MSEQQAFPLTWPEGWPRTNSFSRRPSPFQRSSSYAARRHSMNEVCDALEGELNRLGARKAILSTNVRRRLDGAPYSNQAQPADTGAAVYFELKGKATSLACDKWNRVEDNIWSIVKHIESVRGQNRWGVGTVDQAFRGYQALPAVGQSGGSNWWETLGVPVNASAEQVKEAYRLLVKKHHPDVGGDAELFRRVRAAYDQFESLVPA